MFPFLGEKDDQYKSTMMERKDSSQFNIPIVMAFTPNYFVPASVCISSILQNSDKDDNFHIICLLEDTLPEDMKQKLQRLGAGRVQFSFLDMKGKLQNVYVGEKYTIAASYRLLLPTLLSDYDKIIYLDCDMIIRKNLAQFYRETEIGTDYLAGVYEATLDFQLTHMVAIGCTPGTYINSGFLLMNLAQMRGDNMVERFIKALQVDYLEFPDQDVLNVLCRGRIKGISPTYNGIRTFFLENYKPSFLKYYKEDEWQAIDLSGNVHYTGAKPWEAFTVKFDLWWTYYDHLPSEIKEHLQSNKNIYRLSRFYRYRAGRWLINGTQEIYRLLKKSVKS